MPTILAIDPGSKESGYVVWNVGQQAPEEMGHIHNITLLDFCRRWPENEPMAIEQIRGYGIVAGDDTFDTCQWVGRFEEAHKRNGGIVYMLPRKDIKRHLCGNTTTNDKYIRQALIDRLGEPGTKKNPGTLYGIAGHLWAALAVAVVCADRMSEALKLASVCREAVTP